MKNYPSVCVFENRLGRVGQVDDCEADEDHSSEWVQPRRTHEVPHDDIQELARVGPPHTTRRAQNWARLQEPDEPRTSLPSFPRTALFRVVRFVRLVADKNVLGVLLSFSRKTRIVSWTTRLVPRQHSIFQKRWQRRSISCGRTQSSRRLWTTAASSTSWTVHHSESRLCPFFIWLRVCAC